MNSREINTIGTTQDKLSHNEHRVSKRPTSVMGQSERRSTDRTVNIILADRSSSTNDAIAASDQRPKIAGIKDGVTTSIVNLPQTAQVAVITFGDRAETLIDLQQRGPNPNQLIQKAQTINSGGATAMCAALAQADIICSKAPQGMDALRIFLLSDGIQTDGNPIPIADELKRKYPNLQIHCIGFGDGSELDRVTLSSIATRSSTGAPFYYHVLDAVKLTGILKRQSINLYT